MIEWSDLRPSIEGTLDSHPPESGACAQAAREIREFAVRIDPRAHALVIEPRRGIYVAPLHPAGEKWLHHVTVEVRDHRVDSLTGADGHPSTTYLGRFVQSPDDLRVRPVDEREWEML